MCASSGFYRFCLSDRRREVRNTASARSTSHCPPSVTASSDAAPVSSPAVVSALKRGYYLKEAVLMWLVKHCYSGFLLFLLFSGGNTRAIGMILQYKVPGSEELTQMKFTASEDFSSNKKLSASWLAAMHKVSKRGKTYRKLKTVGRIVGRCSAAVGSMQSLELSFFLLFFLTCRF